MQAQGARLHRQLCRVGHATARVCEPAPSAPLCLACTGISLARAACEPLQPAAGLQHDLPHPPRSTAAAARPPCPAAAAPPAVYPAACHAPPRVAGKPPSLPIKRTVPPCHWDQPPGPPPSDASQPASTGARLPKPDQQPAQTQQRKSPAQAGQLP